MPLKTKFLNLDKLQENEYYNSDVENNNLDKIDNIIENHELRTLAIEKKVHKSNQLFIDLDSSNNSLSVLDAYNGACQLEIQGSLSENLIKNPFFDSADSWNTYYGTHQVKNNILTAIGNGESPALITSQRIGTWYIGRKIFAKARFRTLDNHATSILVALRKTSVTGVALGFTQINNPVAGEWYEAVFDATGVDLSDAHFNLYCSWNENSQQNGKRIELDGNYGNLAVELYEKEKMLSIKDLSKKYIRIFEGLQPLRNVLIKSSGANLFDKRCIRSNGYYNQSGQFVTHTNYDSYGPYPVKSGEKYYFNKGINYIKTFWNNGLFVGWTSSVGEIDIPDDANGIILTLAKANSTEDVTFVEGTIAPNKYNSHSSCKKIFESALAKLPNGACDRIVVENAKTYKVSNTNIGLNGELYKLRSDDVIHVMNGKNISYARIDVNKSLKGILKIFDNEEIGTIFIEGLKEVGLTGWDNSNNANKSFNRFTGNGVEQYLDIFIPLNTSLENAKSYVDGLSVCYQLSETDTIEMLSELEPINSYERYTQFTISDGLIENERVHLKLDSSYYKSNFPQFGTQFNYKVKHIIDITYNDRSIIDLGNIAKDEYAYGDERWSISENKALENNIDMNNIYVTYYTKESNGQVSAKILYNADMTNAISSNSNSISVIAKQVDKLTSKNNDELTWIKPTLQNGWQNYGSSLRDIEYTKDSQGFVHLRGVIKSGLTNTNATIFQLPNNFRPKVEEGFPVVSNSKFGYIVVGKSGNVVFRIGDNSSLMLNGISFYVGINE